MAADRRAVLLLVDVLIIVLASDEMQMVHVSVNRILCANRKLRNVLII